MSTTNFPLWVCPRCGRSFRNERQAHSCGGHSVEELLASAPPSVVQLFREIEIRARRCGPLTLAPTKTRVGLQSGVLFGAIRLGASGLRVELTMPRRIEHERFTKIEPKPGAAWMHQFVVRTLDDLPPEIDAWLCEAHQWATPRNGSRLPSSA